MKKPFILKIVFYIAFVGFAFFSPQTVGCGLSEKIGISLVGAFMCFASAPLGRFIAVKVFRCPEWDKDE